MSRAANVNQCQPERVAAIFAVPLVCANDGIEHLVPDDEAALALVFRGQARAVCGHKVTLASPHQRAVGTCPTCQPAAAVLGLTPA